MSSSANEGRCQLKYEVTFADRARKDLRGIFEYIAKDSPQNASKMVIQLLDAADSLKSFPHRYDVPRAQPTRGRNVRSMPVRPYLIHYRINDQRKTVHILKIKHGARGN